MQHLTDGLDKNNHNKSSRSPGPSCKFWDEAKLNNTVFFVYTWLAVCTVQLINTWHQAGLSLLLFPLMPTQSSLVVFIFCCRLCCYYARMPQ